MFTYSFDDADQLHSLSDPRGGATTQTYDAVGRRTASTELGGDQSAWTYDRSGLFVAPADAISAPSCH